MGDVGPWYIYVTMMAKKHKFLEINFLRYGIGNFTTISICYIRKAAVKIMVHIIEVFIVFYYFSHLSFFQFILFPL